MKIAVHDADAEHFGTHNKFPNYALMKISAYHKAHPFYIKEDSQWTKSPMD